MGRFRVIFFLWVGLLSSGQAASFEISLLHGAPPVKAVGIASINAQGIVFSPSPGQAGTKRYAWTEFAPEGFVALQKIVPQERAFQQKLAEDKVHFLKIIALGLERAQPPPVQPAAPVIPEPPATIIAPAPAVAIPVVAAPQAAPPAITNTPAQPATNSSPPPVPVPGTGAAPSPAPAPAAEEPEASSTVPAFQLMHPAGLQPVPDRRPSDKRFSLGGIFSPAGIALSLIIMGFSVYAGREIALFRNRPVGLVCGLSAVFPVIAPTVFLLLPDPAAQHAEAMAEAHDPHLISNSGTSGALAETMPPETHQPAAMPNYEDDPDSPYLNMEPGQDETHFETTATAPATLEFYRSGDYQIDYHFFNNHFQRFVGNAPPEGQSLILRTREVEYPAHSVARLDAESLNIFYAAGDQWAEETIYYAHIEEVEVRG